jgi:hypothetical protein
MSLSGHFVVSTRSMGAMSDMESLARLQDGPALGLPREPEWNGSLDAFVRQDGVGSTPTLSWVAPVPGPADGYTIQVLHLHGVGLPP